MASITDHFDADKPQTDAHTRLAVMALRKLLAGEPIDPKSCARAYFGKYLTLVEDTRHVFLEANSTTESETDLQAAMRHYWTAVRLDTQYRDIVNAVDTLDIEAAVRSNGHPETPGLALTKLGDLLAEPDETVEWLVEELLLAGGFGLLVAKPKVGKSTLARCLALAVARGEPFLGRRTAQGAVIYLALEEKRSQVRRHFQAMGATGDEEIYIYAATAPADALERIRAVVTDQKPALLIIDPLFRLTRVKDGNSYSEVTQALEPLLVLARETGVHVLAVHHLGKGDRSGADGILGSTAIRGAVDVSVILKRSDRYRTITTEQRYGEDLEETTLRFDPQTRTLSLGEPKEREEVERLKVPIQQWLGAQPEPCTEPAIKDAVEGNNRFKQVALRELVDQKLIDRQGKGTRGEPYTYSLSHLSIYVKCESENPKEPANPDGSRDYAHFGISPNRANSGNEQNGHADVGVTPDVTSAYAHFAGSTNGTAPHRRVNPVVSGEPSRCPCGHTIAYNQKECFQCGKPRGVATY